MRAELDQFRDERMALQAEVSRLAQLPASHSARLQLQVLEQSYLRLIGKLNCRKRELEHEMGQTTHLGQAINAYSQTSQAILAQGNR